MKKKSFGFLGLLILMALSFSVPIPAQLTTNAVKKDLGQSLFINFAGKAVSTDTVITNEFTFPEYDGISLTDYPPVFAAKLSGTSNSTRKVSTYLLGSNFEKGDFVVVDTLLYKDSTNTEILKTFTFKGKKYFRWKLKIIGDTGNNNTTYQQAIYFYRRE